MKIFALFDCFCVLFFTTTCNWLAAQEAGGKKKPPVVEKKEPDPRAKELAALRQSAKAFADAFNRGDAKALAAQWARDGDYTDEAGERFVGREAIEKEYKTFFTEHPGAKITIVVDAVRLLSDSAAIEDGRAVVELGPARGSSTSQYTTVHVKADGKWLMASVRDTRIETPGSASDLTDLEWLIGSWSAEEGDAKMKVTCRWIAGKAFVERTYSVTKGDEVVTSGLQVIGWNPQAGCIQSWNFTSDGGHAVGMWSPHKDGWTIDVNGMLADGTSTTAVNSLTRVNDDSFAWQSTSRTAGGVQLPDADEFVLHREKKE